MLIHPCKYIKDEITVPGDKSISHRAIMLGSIAKGVTEIDNFLLSQDCLNTMECFRKMGIRIDVLPNSKVKVLGNGLRGLIPPKETLYVGNSGTTSRLIMGILAGQNFTSVIDGDESIRHRPMKRVSEPLMLMGAEVYGADNGNYTPITIRGGNLKGINYNSPIPSAQVKSSILLASLYTDSDTTYTEPAISRNHTELMLKYFGGRIKIKNNNITSSPVSHLTSQYITVPGDISSAAFFITLALIASNSQITIKNVGVNPTRTGILDVYKLMGAEIKVENIKKVNNEPIGDITTSSSSLKGIEIGGEIIPRLVDEIPIIAVAATQADGITIIKDAEELRVKESNRIKAIVAELSKMGANIEETPDGIIIKGKTPLKGAFVESYNDHRIAMALSIAAKIATGETYINNSECVNISFPNFFNKLGNLGDGYRG